MYNVPLTTLRDRVDGMISIYTAKSGPASLLSQEEEAKLGSHIKEMAEYGYCYFRAEIIRMSSDYTVFSLMRPKINHSPTSGTTTL